jgi:hypothetical protein
MKRIVVTSNQEIHSILKEAFKHGTHLAYDSYRFSKPVSSKDFELVARVAAILPNAYVLVYSNGDSIKYEVSL